MSLSLLDHYDVLGLKPHATQEEVRLQYRRLVKVFHPDRNDNDGWCQEQLTRINLAYSALTESPPRASYVSGGISVISGRDETWADEDATAEASGDFGQALTPSLVCLAACLTVLTVLLGTMLPDHVSVWSTFFHTLVKSRDLF